MHKPDYKRSIVNLMSSISSAYGHKTRYNDLELLPSKEIKGKKNVLLIIIDGLGYQFLKNKKDSFMWKNTRGWITSVFPSTTTSAITSFITGEGPRQHAFTGWFMHTKETGSVIVPLLFMDRNSLTSLGEKGFDINQFIGSNSLTEKLKTNIYHITKQDIKDSRYSLIHASNSHVFGYNTMNSFFRQAKRALNKDEKKFIYSYWPDFDTISHHKGINSIDAEEHFYEIDRKLKRLAERMKDTKIIVTADHGLIDTTKKTRIRLDDHPRLKECLSMPICGEPRAAFCYVYPSKRKEFEDYVKNKMKRYCWLYKSEDLVRKGFFGLHKEDRRLRHRIGDYALIMKENYVIKDRLMNEEYSFVVGNHGGVSKEEMYVPLTVINT